MFKAYAMASPSSMLTQEPSCAPQSSPRSAFHTHGREWLIHAEARAGVHEVASRSQFSRASEIERLDASPLVAMVVHLRDLSLCGSGFFHDRPPCVPVEFVEEKLFNGSSRLPAAVFLSQEPPGASDEQLHALAAHFARPGWPIMHFATDR